MKLKNTVVPFVLALTATASTFAGSPAARVGDPTSDGGAIVQGAPTVLIGGQPAARVGDMTVDPRVIPNGTGAIACVGGPILTGSATVFIGGQPAARVGDVASTVCGPLQAILVGAPTVLIGN